MQEAAQLLNRRSCVLLVPHSTASITTTTTSSSSINTRTYHVRELRKCTLLLQFNCMLVLLWWWWWWLRMHVRWGVELRAHCSWGTRGQGSHQIVHNEVCQSRGPPHHGLTQQSTTNAPW